ncbi:MAG: hypothetical protein IJG17_08940 [Eubacterium sp.]|nr:hypothetical protein [Eubacterium sp.]
MVSHAWDDEEKVAFAIEHGRGKRLENGHIADLWGIEVDPESGSYFNYGHPLLEIEDEPEFVEQFRAPVVDDMDLQFKYALEEKERYTGEMLTVVSGYNGIWEKTYDLMKIQNFMVTMMEEPEIIHHFFRIITDYKIMMAKETVKRGFKLGHHGDDLGTQTSTFFSEEDFVSFIKPYLKELFDVYHSAGKRGRSGSRSPSLPRRRLSNRLLSFSYS